MVSPIFLALPSPDFFCVNSRNAILARRVRPGPRPDSAKKKKTAALFEAKEDAKKQEAKQGT